MKSSVLIIAVLACGVAFAAEPADDAGELRRHLDRGDIVLLEADSSRSGGSARVQALIRAPVQAVWNVITSCEQSFVFVNGLQQCRVIEEDEARALVHQVVKTGWLAPTQDFIFESLREPYSGIRFQLVEGNLKEMEGAWRFTESPEGIYVDYSIRVRPRLPVPGFIVSWVMRRGMPDIIACIRGLADGSGLPEQRRADLERCRGNAEPIP